MLFLIIDDDELSRELFAMLLEAEGHEVEVAASGDEALARVSAAERSSPDVVLSDMRMPGLSGEALASALRKVLSGKTRLLAMSGSQSSQAGLMGFDGFLLKPFSMADLDAAIAERESGFDPPVGEEGAGTVGAESGVPALNEEIYAKMAKMMPAKQLGELYAMCLADTRKRLAQMGSLAEAGDDEGYRMAAHTVKGGCGMIGAAELYALAEAAERDGLWPNSGQDARTSTVWALLERACDRLERILGERG